MPNEVDAKRLEELRVAQAELSSGDTSGRVLVQSSPGAVFRVTERSATKETVASEIRQLVLKDISLLEESKMTK